MRTETSFMKNNRGTHWVALDNNGIIVCEGSYNFCEKFIHEQDNFQNYTISYSIKNVSVFLLTFTHEGQTYIFDVCKTEKAAIHLLHTAKNAFPTEYKFKVHNYEAVYDFTTVKNPVVMVFYPKFKEIFTNLLQVVIKVVDKSEFIRIKETANKAQSTFEPYFKEISVTHNETKVYKAVAGSKSECKYVKMI